MSHARLAPSAAHRWMKCTGSLQLIESLPESVQNTTSVYADEGSKAHALAANILADKAQTITADEDMAQAVQVFVDAARARQAETKATLHIEKYLGLDRIKPRPPIPMGGTPDVVMVSEEWIEIWDYKHGQGVVVEAEGNEQLMTYVLAAILQHGTRPHYAVVIVQPRAHHELGPIRRWEPTGAEIQTFRYEMLRAAHEAVGPKASLHAGEHCQFCPARGHCKELAAHSQLVAQAEFQEQQVVVPNPQTLPLAEAAEMLTKVPVLELWIKALRDRIEAELNAGHPVPGWKLVAKRAMRVWNSEDEVREWAKAEGYKTKDITKTELLSPAQIEKVVGKKNLPAKLYTSISSGTTVAPESDKRPAVLQAPTEFRALPSGTPIPTDSKE